MTTKELIRRRIAPAVFIIGMAMIVQHTCNGAQRTHATFVLDLGEAAKTATVVDATLVVDGSPEPLITFHRIALDGKTIGPCTFQVAMPAESGQLEVDVTLPTGIKHVTRLVHVTDEGSTVTVNLGSSLTP